MPCLFEKVYAQSAESYSTGPCKNKNPGVHICSLVVLVCLVYTKIKRNNKTLITMETLSLHNVLFFVSFRGHSLVLELRGSVIVMQIMSARHGYVKTANMP